MVSFIAHNGLLIHERFIEVLKEGRLASFEELWRSESGTVLKKKRFRSIAVVKLQGRTFYLKRHVYPLRERLASLLPWIRREGARNEWENIVLLERLGFNTMTPVAFGEKKSWGSASCSLTMTEDIYGAVKLESYFPEHFAPPLSYDKVIRKRELITSLAMLARDFHGKGLNHQDFYLGHLFMRPADGRIFIIDVQRMHRRSALRRRDRVKDLAQLYYSARCARVFTKADVVRFAHRYLGKDKLTASDRALIKDVMAKALRIARHDANLQRRRHQAGDR